MNTNSSPIGTRILNPQRSALAFIVTAICSACLAVAAQESSATGGAQPGIRPPAPAAGTFRVATFNCSLNRDEAGGLLRDLEGGQCEQARQVAAIIQRIRPDLLLLCEFDHDPEGRSLRVFQEQYLAVSCFGGEPIRYEWSFAAESNTGVESGVDMNKDGKLALPDDGFGFGRHPGQYGMAVLSKFEIDADRVRTFRNFLWRDLPGARLPVDPSTGEAYYTGEDISRIRLSSKSHWDVPVRWGEEWVHFLVCHPTPPVFDGPEDRNGLRNHDEIRFWAEYVSGSGDWIVDDAGKRGGLPEGAKCVIAGDLNADPVDGESTDSPVRLLLEHPRLTDPQPVGPGGKEQAEIQGGANRRHKGLPERDTGDFSDRTVGNLRIDYVLPSGNMRVVACGVFWPAQDDPDFPLVSCSDHRMVWVDLDPLPAGGAGK